MRRRVLLKSLAGAAAAGALPAWAGLEAQLPAAKADPAQGIHMNQLGFTPEGPKRASIVLEEGGDGGPFAIKEAVTQAVVHRGWLGLPARDAASGDRVAVADFSRLTKPGRYHLETAGRSSDIFPIRESAYAGVLRSAMRGFYGQRCGCAVDLGGGYRHGPCHTQGKYHKSSGKAGTLRNAGGWHDAGDYGRYVVNAAVATGTLLWAWEMYPDALAHMDLAIPESGDGIPDFLSEVRWNLQWLLTMQDEDGGVWHKQTSEHFCGMVRPEADTLPSLITGTGKAPYKSTCATADFAAVTAVAARSYLRYDLSFANRCLHAARMAYTWAVAHPDVPFHNPEGVTTGEYGDGGCSDELLWAAAELFRSTGEPAYERAFLTGITARRGSLAVVTPSWSDVGAFGLWTYVLSGRGTSASAKETILAATAEAAAARVQRSRSNGYGNTLSEADYIWGSNGVAGNDSLLLLVAHRLKPGVSLRDAASANLHYLLGRNCFGVSWVTQAGTRPFAHPHHRPSIADGIDLPWPGLLAAGPNARGGDPVADALPARPPMRMWVDDQRAYALNEVAINWNAPLVFLLAGVNSRGV